VTSSSRAGRAAFQVRRVTIAAFGPGEQHGDPKAGVSSSIQWIGEWRIGRWQIRRQQPPQAASQLDQRKVVPCQRKWCRNVGNWVGGVTGIDSRRGKPCGSPR